MHCELKRFRNITADYSWFVHHMHMYSIHKYNAVGIDGYCLLRAKQKFNILFRLSTPFIFHQMSKCRTEEK